MEVYNPPNAEVLSAACLVSVSERLHRVHNIVPDT